MLRNDTKVTHYIHLHEEAWHTVALIDAKGHRHAPPPWEDGLEDTWRLDPGTAVEVAARFTDYPGVFMIHCHMLDHEDDGMMAQFAVVNPNDPQLPAGYRYQPLSGRHRLLVSATTAGAKRAMPGMGSPSASAPHRHRTPPAAAAPAETGSGGSGTLAQSGRSIAVEAALVVVALLAVRVRGRRRRRRA